MRARRCCGRQRRSRRSRARAVPDKSSRGRREEQQGNRQKKHGQVRPHLDARGERMRYKRRVRNGQHPPCNDRLSLYLPPPPTRTHTFLRIHIACSAFPVRRLARKEGVVGRNCKSAAPLMCRRRGDRGEGVETENAHGIHAQALKREDVSNRLDKQLFLFSSPFSQTVMTGGRHLGARHQGPAAPTRWRGLAVPLYMPAPSHPSWWQGQAPTT